MNTERKHYDPYGWLIERQEACYSDPMVETNVRDYGRALLNYEQFLVQGLAFFGSVEHRRAVASHPDVADEVLRVLVEDTESSVRLAVAGNLNTPLDCLALLASVNAEQLESVRLRAAATRKWQDRHIGGFLIC